MSNSKPQLVIAGPGAGKTYNMVGSIVDALPNLSPARYLAVITYTNSATNNIKRRLSERVKIPENLFIGTIHAFMNRFIVIPYGSYSEEEVGQEKRFIQCQLDHVFEQYKKDTGKSFSKEEVGIVKSRIRKRLNEQGYVSFDQSLNIAAKSMSDKEIANLVSNRIQYLFIDEFQDTNNKVFDVVEVIRKLKKTKMYVVGDPEQYITSFDSSIKKYTRIPILKAANTSVYDLSINQVNRRSAQKIVSFLNQFNGRIYGSDKFEQIPHRKTEGYDVTFIDAHSDTKPIIEEFFSICDSQGIPEKDRCILAKKNDVIKRIEKVLDGRSISPNQNGASTPLHAIKDAILSSVQMTQKEFYEKYECNNMTLRQYCVQTMIAINQEVITNETTFLEYITEEFGLTVKSGIPVKINGLKYRVQNTDQAEFTLVGNIHQIKGLEAVAVLAIAKTEAELNLWLTTTQEEREEKRGKEDTDYPRLGYVAFSRAEDLLCIGCLEQISDETKNKLGDLQIVISNSGTPEKPKVKPLF